MNVVRVACRASRRTPALPADRAARKGRLVELPYTGGSDAPSPTHLLPQSVAIGY